MKHDSELAAGAPTQASPQPRRRLLIVGAVCLLVLAGFLAVVLWIDDARLRAQFSNYTLPLFSLLAALALGAAARRLRAQSRQAARAWALMAAGYLAYTCGNIIWSTLELAFDLAPFPSLANAFYLLYYPLVIAGLLSMPLPRLSRGAMLRRTLDLSIVAISIIVVYWNVVLGHLVNALPEIAPLEAAVSLAHAVADLTLGFVLLTVLLYRSPGNRWPVMLISLSAVFIILSDAIYGPQVWVGAHVSGSSIDAGWVTAYLLAILAGVTQSVQPAPQGKTRVIDSRPVLWWSLLVYLWPTAIFLLLIWSDLGVWPMSHASLVVTVWVIISLLIVRQFIALRENAALYDRLNDELSNRTQTLQELKESRDLFAELVQVARATASSTSVESTVESAQRISLSITSAERVSLFLVDPLGTILYRLLDDGQLDSEQRGVADEVMHHGLAGWVYEHQESALVPETRQDERWIVLQDESIILHSALVVPITAGAERLGVLSVYHTLPNRFSPQHLEFLRAAADQIGLALCNARAFDEQRRLAGELEQAKEAAEAASRAKSLFLARTSHELRTPLAIILGYAEILQEELRRMNRPDMFPRLQKIENAAQHLLDLINDVLDYSRLDTGRMELSTDLFSVPDLVQEVHDSVAPLALNRQNKLRVTCGPDMGMMKGDLQRVRQVLMNLLQNACKFTDQGIVSLDVQREQGPESDWITFIVSDTGIGMNEEQLQRLFTAFDQVDASITDEYGGIGLGLAITHSLVQMMKGSIEVQSRVDHGTTFKVRLPMTAATLETGVPL